MKKVSRSVRYTRGAFSPREILIIVAAFLAVFVAALVFSRRNPESRRIEQARAEMALLAAALVKFKAKYGDYPHIPADGGASVEMQLSGKRLFAALAGWRGVDIGDESQFISQQAVFIDWSSLRLAKALSSEGPNDNYVLDPWNSAYSYTYVPSAENTSGPILYSLGPDGDATASARWLSARNLEETKNGLRVNEDNIYVRLP